MKSKFLVILSLSSLILGSCVFLPIHRNNSSSSESQSSDTTISSEEQSISSSTDSKDSSSSSESIPEEEIEYIDIYATNDIHGAVMEETINGHKRPGIGKLMTYLKDKGDKPNTLLLDQGDTWQGSIYSNYNHGRLITDVMNYVHYDARTIGNHDFDWGVDYLINNGKLTGEDGYKTPVLAGNVYDYDFDNREEGTRQLEEIGDTSVTYVLDNGLKVGIIGCIPRFQITTINSMYTEEICFKDPIPFIKEEALKLRRDEGCDAVICSVHGGQEDVVNRDLERYVDLVLCAHTHQLESTVNNGLHFYQYGCYGEYVGHITISYSKDRKKIIDVKNETIYAWDIVEETTEVDSYIQGLIDSYNAECENEANEVVANNVFGRFLSTTSLPNLMANAMYDQAVKEGYTIDLAYVNKARSNIEKTSWTYSDLYTAFPFDNLVFIMEIDGEEFMNEIAYYNNIYRSPDFTSDVIDMKGTYRIAVIDYLCYHTDSNRRYDYFPKNGGKTIGTLQDNYRVILKNWLKANNYNNGERLDYTNYLSSNWSFNNTVFTHN